MLRGTLSHFVCWKGNIEVTFACFIYRKDTSEGTSFASRAPWRALLHVLLNWNTCWRPLYHVLSAGQEHKRAHFICWKSIRVGAWSWFIHHGGIPEGTLIFSANRVLEGPTVQTKSRNYFLWGKRVAFSIKPRKCFFKAPHLRFEIFPL